MSRARDLANLLSTNSPLIDGAPAALDTLNELAAALNDDANFATTVTNSIATKLSTEDFNKEMVAYKQFSADGSLLQNIPTNIHPAEKLLKESVFWIDAAHSSAGSQTVRNLGWGGSALDAQCGSTAGADSNDPKFLEWVGENYVYLPGVSGNYLSVPDEAALDITGDIDIRILCVTDTLPVTRSLVAKYETSGNQRQYQFTQQSTGVLQFVWSADGVVANVVSSTQTIFAAGYSSGDPVWLRVTFDVDNGASGNDVEFFWSSDGSSWTQVGATVTTAGVASLFDGSGTCNVGARGNSGIDALPAKVYRAQVLDGIDGTTVLDVDCSQITSGSATSFTALTGQTVTINRSTSGRKSVAVVSPVWLFGTDDYMEVADNALMDFTQAEDFTLITVVRAWGTAAALETTATKKQSTSAGAPGYLLGINTSNATTSRIADGTNQSVVTTGSYSSGVVSVIGFIRDATAGTMQNFTNNTFAAASSVTMTATSENDRPFNVGRLAGNANYFNGEVLAVALYRRKLSASEIATLNSYFQGRAA